MANVKILKKKKKKMMVKEKKLRGKLTWIKD